MTSPLVGIGGAPTSVANPSSRTELGRDQFLTLLVAQLQHQDPLNPMEPDQFAAQLAQFSSVEQLTKLNATVASQQADSAELALLNKTNLGASLIGRQVLVADNQFVVSADGSTTPIQVDVAGNGGTATLTLLDASGREVTRRVLGTVGGGTRTITPPNDLPPGNYRYRLNVENAAGEPIGVRMYTRGVVDGVSFEGGQVLLRIGALRVPLDTLSEITH